MLERKQRRVYVTQFGAWWSLPPQGWAALVRDAAADDGYDLSDPRYEAKELQGPPAQGAEYYSPQDWSEVDFLEEAAIPGISKRLWFGVRAKGRW